MNLLRVASNRVWSLILAGGDGERLQPLIYRWLGHHKPKQYCTFTGTRSLFQHTLDRADMLTIPAHRITVCARAHRQEALAQLQGRSPGTVLLQPANRGTVAGTFLPLMYVRACDPEATVVVYPSDHFIYPEDRFIEIVQRAVWTAEWLENRLVLLGAAPDSPEVEYGWVVPGQHLAWTAGRRVRTVHTFHEKPDLAGACTAWSKGALWNTMVLVAKVKTFWDLGWRCVPEVMPTFEQIAHVIGSPRQKAVMDAAYHTMPALDFSTNVLQKAADQLTLIELNDVMWSDWGKEKRIVETLHKVDKQPAFPPEFVTAHREVVRTA